MPETVDACQPLSKEFKDHVFNIERDPLDYEQQSSMIRDFVLMDKHSNLDCQLSVKLKNLEDAGFALPIFADSTLWRVQVSLVEAIDQKRLAK